MADPTPRQGLERIRQLVTRLELYTDRELDPYREDLDEAREGLQAVLAHVASTDSSPTPGGTP